jgi:predicted RNA-binding protein YlxR (DUF448 family)
MSALKQFNLVSVPSSSRKFKRQCVACRGYFPKEQLVKLVKVAPSPLLPLEPLVHLNPSAAIFGRSLYCCNTSACLHKLLSKQGKFLKQRLKITTLPTPLLSQLEQLLSKAASVESPLN